MAYRRRYFKTFVGTTATIADQAITQDKMAPYSVGPEELKPDSVRESKVLDGSLEGKDLKDRTIEGDNIALLTLAGEHFEDDTIPLTKLSFTPSVRPLVPGVSSAEIIDGAVIETKYGADSIPVTAYKPGSVDETALAGDAVTEVKIKDGEITTAKYKTSSVDQAALGANSVGGPEIQDGQVSHDKLSADAVERDNVLDGEIIHDKLAADAVERDNVLDGEIVHDKLAADAVETVNVLDDNVTAPKLARDSLRKFLTVAPLIRDDFEGAALSHVWGTSGDAGGSALLMIDHQVAIKTSGVINEKYRLNYNGVKSFAWDKAPKETWLVKLPSVANIKVEIGMYKGAGDYYLFRYDSSVDGNWHAIGRVGAGGEIDQTTSIAATTNPINLAIDYIADQNVKFYVDDVLKITQIDPGPSGDYEPYIEAETLIGAIKEVDLDAFIHQESRV